MVFETRRIELTNPLNTAFSKFFTAVVRKTIIFEKKTGIVASLSFCVQHRNVFSLMECHNVLLNCQISKYEPYIMTVQNNVFCRKAVLLEKVKIC